MTDLEHLGDWSNGSFDVLWRQVWQVAVVALLVSVVVRVVCRRNPHLAYLLWTLVLLKAITPPLWTSPVGAFCWVGGLSSPMSHSPVVSASAEPGGMEPVHGAGLSAAVGLQPQEPASPLPAEPASSFASREVLALIWMCGVGIMVAILLGKRVRLWRQLATTSLPTPPRVRQLAVEQSRVVGLRRGVRIRVTSLPLPPCAYGVFRPTVVLPASLCSSDNEAALRTILTHELLHIRRWDTWTSTAQLVVQVSYWFHPFIWLANRELRRERERCCDEQVLAFTQCRPLDYAKSLLAVVEMTCQRRATPAWALEAGRLTASRLRDIMRSQGRARTRTPRACWLFALVAALIVLPGKSLRDLARADDESGPADAASSESVGPGAAGIGVRNVPPVVVRTVPPAGTGDVDPRLSQIEVTFSKPMLDQSWSWSQLGGESFPETVGEPRYLDDRRTCVLKVKLEPNHTYAIWLNSSRFHNFRDRAGQPAVPYLLVFKTSSRSPPFST